MWLILPLIVLSDEGTFDIAFAASEPSITSAIFLQAERMSLLLWDISSALQ